MAIAKLRIHSPAAERQFSQSPASAIRFRSARSSSTHRSCRPARGSGAVEMSRERPLALDPLGFDVDVSEPDIRPRLGQGLETVALSGAELEVRIHSPPAESPRTFGP